MVNDEERRKAEKAEYKRSLFSQLTRAEVEQLHQNYIVDFQMFGYDIDQFLDYAQ